MQITKEWLEEKNACQKGMEFVEEKNLIGLEGTEFIRKLMEYEQYEYANWLIVRIMDREQCVKYARFSADLAKKYADWAERAEYWAERAERAEYWADCAERAADWADRAESAERAEYWAYWAERAERAEYKKILNYGLKLLEGKIA